MSTVSIESVQGEVGGQDPLASEPTVGQTMAIKAERLAEALKVFRLGEAVDGRRSDMAWRVKSEELFLVTHRDWESWCNTELENGKRRGNQLAAHGRFRELVCRPLGTAVPDSDWPVRDLVGRPLDQQEEVVRYLIEQHGGRLDKFVKAEVNEAIEKFFFLEVQDQKPRRRRKRGRSLPAEDRRVIIRLRGRATVIDVDECELPDDLVAMRKVAKKIASYGEPAIPTWKRAASPAKRQAAMKAAVEIVNVVSQVFQDFDPVVDGDPQEQMDIPPRGVVRLDLGVDTLLSSASRNVLTPGELPDIESAAEDYTFATRAEREETETGVAA